MGFHEVNYLIAVPSKSIVCTTDMNICGIEFLAKTFVRHTTGVYVNRYTPSANFVKYLLLE